MKLIFGATVIAAQPSMPKSEPVQIQSTRDELLSYSCAQSVAGLLDPEDQPGPVFSNLGLVFTSILARDSSPLLLVSAGAGTYAIPLYKVGVNRISFSIPVHGLDRPRTYYLGYLHDSVMRSRVFDISSDRPPIGRQAADFDWVSPHRTVDVQANLHYSIHETAEALLASLTEGRLKREQLRRVEAGSCAHITRKNPALGRNLKRNLDVVEMIAFGPTKRPSRMPASQR